MEPTKLFATSYLSEPKNGYLTSLQAGFGEVDSREELAGSPNRHIFPRGWFLPPPDREETGSCCLELPWRQPLGPPFQDANGVLALAENGLMARAGPI